MNDYRNLSEDLALTRQELAGAVAALGKRLGAGRLSGSDAAGSGRETPQEPQAFAAVKAAMPALGLAGSVIRSNPLASVLTGAGLAWLAWSGLRRKANAPRETLPQWLIEAGGLREEARRLKSRVDEAEASGVLDARGAKETREEIAASLASETRRLMGQGLDGLEEETRAAALTAREAAWQRAYGDAGGRKSGLGGFAKVLTAGTALAGLGGLVAAVMARASPAEAAVSEAETVVRETTEAARKVIADEADRLAKLAADLSRAIREITEEAETAGDNPPHG